MKEVTIDTTTEFNPMQDIPTNDEQAEIALRYGRQLPLADNLCGIYQCRRATGATVIEAFKVALLAQISAYINTQQACDEATDEPTKQTWWAGYEYIDASKTQK